MEIKAIDNKEVNFLTSKMVVDMALPILIRAEDVITHNVTESLEVKLDKLWGIRFKVDSTLSKNNLGFYNPSSHEISIGFANMQKFTTQTTLRGINSTLIHEIAHLVVTIIAGIDTPPHGALFKRVVIALGGNSRTALASSDIDSLWYKEGITPT